MQSENAPHADNFLATGDENALEHALQTEWSDDRAREHFFGLLFRSTVYVFPGAPLPSDAVLAQSAALRILSWRSSDGAITLPIFTSLEALRRSPQGRPNFLTLSFESILRNMPKPRLYLNAGSVNAKEFTAADAYSFAAPKFIQPVYVAVLNTPGYFIDLHVHVPHNIDQNLRVFCNDEKNVQFAYVSGIRENTVDAKTVYRVSLVLRGNETETMRAVMQRVRDRSLPAGSIEFVQMSQDGDANDIEAAIKSSQPFYRRLERVVRQPAPVLQEVSFLKKLEDALSLKRFTGG